MIIKCPECGHQVSDQAATCPSCGIRIAGNVVPCPECGAMVFRNQTVCPICNAPISQQPVQPIYNNVEKKYAVDGNIEVSQEAHDKQPKKSKKVVLWIFVVAIVVSLSVFFAGLYFYQNMLKRNEQEAYENAIISDEPSVLQNYIDIYGKDAPQEHLDSVMIHINRFRQMEKDWNDARISRNKSMIEAYLRTHPGTIHEIEAKLMIDSIDWVVTVNTDTQDAYRTYMDSHRDGQHYDEAMQKFEKKLEEQRQVVDTLVFEEVE